MNDYLEAAFAILCLKCGSHTDAAKFLGLSRDHYCALRKGRRVCLPVPLNIFCSKPQEVSCWRGLSAAPQRGQSSPNLGQPVTV